ncbi:uncharacterized protein Z519_04817 [Cladophialophora bantiana CBS 173.52]|uniref:Gfo/Idh/MocA-like oxidoreductase N-terminal domain-containing protein n=1 Tax=Cladophialophora bantiana (strain ATCC 10958 / CBS 173.52 / CDC B-1940 / NIH 8579) TaxID=1442370 RepID=A0A0D2IDJ8_CLAB1|nr:uncharacterized protein Z519_04817 [Cladophialophora bantiana CBS 173.52]KIW94839.1 hypothetical protein Z519_04817 [Cladophialophora bantiana CBS 173.52]
MTASGPTRPPRTALIGLSSSPTGHGWLSHFHLPAIQKHTADFQIVAVLSSSLANAQKAIAKHNLPSTVRAYGAPEDLARDEEVDFLVVGVKAPLHRTVLMPSLLSKRLKGIFVEWPIDCSFAKTEEIVRLAREQGLRTAVGLQGRFSTITQRISQLVRSGQLGKILSTTAVGTVPTGDGKSEKRSSQYALDPANGATMVDVHLAHFIECLTFALDADVATVSGQVKTMHPTTNIVDDDTGESVERDAPKKSPDQVLVQGTLKSRSKPKTGPGPGPKSRQPRDGREENNDNNNNNNIVYSIHMRGGNSISGGMTWLIYGTDGEMEITTPLRMIPHINLPVPWKIRMKIEGEGEGQAGTISEVVEEEVSEQEAGQPAVDRLWDAFVRGGQEREGEGPWAWPDFEHALKIHHAIDAVWTSSRDGKVVEL